MTAADQEQVHETWGRRQSACRATDLPFGSENLAQEKDKKIRQTPRVEGALGVHRQIVVATLPPSSDAPLLATTCSAT